MCVVRSATIVMCVLPVGLSFMPLRLSHSVNVCMVRHKDYHPVPWVEHRSKFHYDYDADELTPESHRECSVLVCVFNVIQCVLEHSLAMVHTSWKGVYCMLDCLFRNADLSRRSLIQFRNYGALHFNSNNTYMHLSHAGVNVPMYILDVSKKGDFIVEVSSDSYSCFCFYLPVLHVSVVLSLH